MKSFVVVICLLAVDLGRSANHEFPKITGNDPFSLDLPHSFGVELKCQVAKLNDSIAWIYNNTTKFSCDPPYGVGTCVNSLGSPYKFTINGRENMIMVEFPLEVNVNDGNWTCRHGNDTSHPYDLDVGSTPATPNLTISNMKPVEGENVTFTCMASMRDVNLTKFFMRAWDGVNMFYLMDLDDPTNLTYTFTHTVECKTIMYFCSVFNKYGGNYMSHKISVNCPVEFQKELTPTNVSAEEGANSVELIFYYTGIPSPEFQWYRIDSDMEMNLTEYRNRHLTRDQCKPTGTACVVLVISKPIEADTGYYVVYGNETKSGMMQSHKFHLNIMLPKTPTTKTYVPSETKPCSAPQSDELTFGQGIGIGIGIGLGLVIFVAGGIYGCRKA